MKVKPPHFQRQGATESPPVYPARQGSSAGAAFLGEPQAALAQLPSGTEPSTAFSPRSGARQGCPGLSPPGFATQECPSCSREQYCRYPAPTWGIAIISTGTAGSPHPACALEIPRCSSKISLKRRANKKPGTQPHLPEHGEADGLIQGLVPKENQN